MKRKYAILGFILIASFPLTADGSHEDPNYAFKQVLSLPIPDNDVTIVDCTSFGRLEVAIGYSENARGYASIARYSEDCIHWQNVDPGIPSKMERIRAGAEVILAIANMSSQRSSGALAFVSTDGMNWRTIGGIFADCSFKDIAYAPDGAFLVVGCHGDAASSWLFSKAGQFIGERPIRVSVTAPPTFKPSVSQYWVNAITRGTVYKGTTGTTLYWMVGGWHWKQGNDEGLYPIVWQSEDAENWSIVPGQMGAIYDAFTSPPGEYMATRSVGSVAPIQNWLFDLAGVHEVYGHLFAFTTFDSSNKTRFFRSDNGSSWYLPTLSDLDGSFARILSWAGPILGVGQDATHRAMTWTISAGTSGIGPWTPDTLPTVAPSCFYGIDIAAPNKSAAYVGYSIPAGSSRKAGAIWRAGDW